jgi:hypothetical protein
LCHFSWDMFPANTMAYDMQFHHSLAGEWGKLIPFISDFLRVHIH